MLRAFIISGVLSFAAVNPAVAQSAPDKNQGEIDKVAGGHYKLGSSFYQAGKYEAARIEFEAAYELSSAADLLHNLSLVAERQERWADAIRYEDEFLSAPTLALSQREKDEARGRIVRLREQQRLSASTPPAPAPTPPAPAPTRPRASLVAGAIGLSMGGGMLIASIGTGGYALALKNDLESRPISRTELDDGLSLGRTLQSATIALAVVGGTVAVGSIALLAVSRRRPR